MQIEALMPIDKFIKDIEDRFSQSDVELIKRVNAFAKKHYSHIEHPIGKLHNEYATEVAMILTDLYADPIIIASALIYPPSQIKFEAFEEIKKEFKSECGLIKLLEEVYHLSQFDWNIWPALTDDDTFRERQEVLRRMFLLAIEDTNIIWVRSWIF